MTPPGPKAWTAPGNDYRGIEKVQPGPEPNAAVILTGGSVRDSLLSQSAGVSEILDPAAARGTPAEVVVFLGPDEDPGPGWLARHLGWHQLASNLVVLGGHVPEDDRSTAIIRRSRRLLSGDEAFIAIQQSNVSMRTELWDRLGSPGELDLITGWRLWNEGAFFIHDPDASVTASGPALPHTGSPGWALLLEDLIPHRRFRPRPSALHSTPKVSWVVQVSDQQGVEAAWEVCQKSTFPDHEIVFHGPASALVAVADVARHNPRVTTVEGDGPGSIGAAVRACHGELVAIFDSRAHLPPESLSKAVARFEAKPSAGVVRLGYRIGGDRYLRFDDLAAVDRALGAYGLPLFAVASRRELMKDPLLVTDPATAWKSLLARNTPALVVSPLVEVDASAPISPRSIGFTEISSAGLGEMARVMVREMRRERASDEATARSMDDERVSVAYVGFTGHDNLGDEAVMTAIQSLMPWAHLESDPVDPRLLMVGGGTLINGRRYYLNRLLRQESPVVERALFGTGVRNPDYWGVTEPMDDWFSFIDSALVAAVRGPDSVKNLRKLGYHRDLPVIGDPALSLFPPDDFTRVEGRVVVCPVFTSGNLHGGSDEVVFAALADLVLRLRAEGRDVILMSAFPQDDRWLIDLMRRSEVDDLPYFAGYANIDETMGLMASADLVVGERLHATIMAAAAGTPFVGVEYRPKVRDFARSVGQENAVVRTDEMHRLQEVCDRILASSEEAVAVTAVHVDAYRRMQIDAANELHRLLVAG